MLRSSFPTRGSVTFLLSCSLTGSGPTVITGVGVATVVEGGTGISVSSGISFSGSGLGDSCSIDRLTFGLQSLTGLTPSTTIVLGPKRKPSLA
jgi:hypothetical protein